MAWKGIKRFLGRKANDTPSKNPSLNWIEADENPWGVRVLDVRPITHTMLSSSTDPQIASNALSYGSEDGSSFVGIEPANPRVVDASLLFPVDRRLVDGALFIPLEMEHKWAIFFQKGEIIFVRSWLREVKVIAKANQRDEHIEITQIRGTFLAEDEEPELSINILDYLLQSHALNVVYPAPLPKGMESDLQKSAMWCMSMFGNLALIATPHSFVRTAPIRPLRSMELP